MPDHEKNNDKTTKSAYRTHAIYDEESRDRAGVINTTKRGVIEAKEFVEKNQL
ncbi:MAG: hypothetical protein FWE91_01825 [Defluviitaleaceae bacterium]|nr:hypothetical protein [Defluviitaleaceae bacterium]MCL2835890.1 hypothetical protein [Defluviitaleaceae bacterium]